MRSGEVAAAEAAHMASAAHVAATTSVTAAAARLRIGGHEAAGKRCACQDHQHLSSHHILL
jgi:hypothetical protein